MTSIKYPFLVSKNWGSPKGNNRGWGGDFWRPPFSHYSHEFWFHTKDSKIPYYDVIWAQFNDEKVIKINESRRKTVIAKINTKNSKIPYYDVILTPFNDENDEKVIKNS